MWAWRIYFINQIDVYVTYAQHFSRHNGKHIFTSLSGSFWSLLSRGLHKIREVLFRFHKIPLECYKQENSDINGRSTVPLWSRVYFPLKSLFHINMKNILYKIYLRRRFIGLIHWMREFPSVNGVVSSSNKNTDIQHKNLLSQNMPYKTQNKTLYHILLHNSFTFFIYFDTSEKNIKISFVFNPKYIKLLFS